MELTFIRHGQGIHNTDVPDRLNIENPRLTEKGKDQVNKIRSQFSFNENDLIVVSPTIRTYDRGHE
jgi:broad specificity phosphatase PhoE